MQGGPWCIGELGATSHPEYADAPFVLQTLGEFGGQPGLADAGRSAERHRLGLTAMPVATEGFQLAGAAYERRPGHRDAMRFGRLERRHVCAEQPAVVMKTPETPGFRRSETDETGNVGQAFITDQFAGLGMEGDALGQGDPVSADAARAVGGRLIRHAAGRHAPARSQVAGDAVRQGKSRTQGTPAESAALCAHAESE